MKLRQLAAGVATGYVTKAVQFVATMALVPFLLRPEILGVDDYGRAYTLIAFMGLGSVLTAGIRLSFVRSVSRDLGAQLEGGGHQIGRLIGSGTAVLLVICGVISAIGLVFEVGILGGVRFPDSDEYRVAWRLALVWMTAENALFLFRSPLMARGAISFVNYVVMAEVALRLVTLVVLLPRTAHPFAVYFAAHALFCTLRSLAFVAWSLVRFPDDLRGLAQVRFESIRETLLYSTSITLAHTASFLVLRAPVMLASRYLGATEAGFIAIVINTIQNYVQQMLLAVVQPIAVPIAARFDPRRISAAARSFFYDLEGLYCASVIVVTSLLTVVAPDLVLIWLGPGYEPIVLPAQVILAGCAVEIAYAVRRSLLIGQGLLQHAIFRILAMAIVTTLAVSFCIIVQGEWAPAAFVTGGYLIVSNVLGIGSIWSRHFAVDEERSRGRRRFAAFLPALAAAIAGSLFAGELDWRIDVALAGTALAWSVLCVQLLVMPVRRIGTTLQRLRLSMDRDLFGAR